MLATDEERWRSRSTASSVAASAATSPNATATPSAEAARPNAISRSGSPVRQGAPAAAAATISSSVGAGPFTWTRWTSAARSIPASAIASRTAAATVSICSRRPTEAGDMAGVNAAPIASAGPGIAPAAAGATVNTL